MSVHPALNDNDKLDKLIEEMQRVQRQARHSTLNIVYNIEQSTKRIAQVSDKSEGDNGQQQPNEDN